MLEKPRLRISVITLAITGLLALQAGASENGEELSKVRVLWDQRVPMRDGVETSADVFLPRAEGRYSTLLMRNPYTKSTRLTGVPYDFLYYFAQRGYALVGEDVRGRGDSDGEFGYYHGDVEDGYDAVEWAASQPWSNGKVCMIGLSYLATVQWQAAKVKPPHLVCLVSTAAAGDFMNEIGYIGGAFTAAGNLDWVNSVSGRTWQSMALVNQQEAGHFDWEDVLWHRPLNTMDEVFGRKMQIYRDYLAHPTMDDYWKQIRLQPEDFKNIELPVLHITGWFDGDQAGAMHYWRGMQQYSKVKDQQYLVVGPWEHANTFFGGPPFVGEMQFGPESMLDRMGLHLEFLDHYLKGTAEKYERPKSRLYITGANEWREYDAYPPREAKEVRFYLHSGGNANTLDGDGGLGPKPGISKDTDKFTFDPKNPVPTYVTDTMAIVAIDHRMVESRDDVLVYTSDLLDEPIDVVGNVHVELYAASDALDTDFTAKILEVFPDGRAIRLGSPTIGVIRARYRHGMDKEVLLTPGKVEKYIIDLLEIGHQFSKGNRIRIEISSSSHPMYAPNQNTGNPVATDIEWNIAHQTIHHDKQYPSALVLSVTPQ